jgi:hypothetical protein
MRRLALLLLTSMSAGCQAFLNPPVVCQDNTFTYKQTSTPARTGAPCVFPDLSYNVAYAPQVDQTRVTSDTAYLTLAGGQVTVTGGNAAVFVCPGTDGTCTPDSQTADVVISPRGVLSYQVLMIMEGLAPVLRPGDTYSSQGVLVSESFGPGNSCNVLGTFELTCKKPEG